MLLRRFIITALFVMSATNVLAEDRVLLKIKAVAVAMQQTIEHERIPGSVKAKADATIEAKISGKIDQLLVGEGSIVKEGDTLLHIAAKEIDARLEQALASAKQAKQDSERYTKLLPSGAITRQEYDAAMTRLQVAEASVSEAQTMVGYTKIQAPFDGVVTHKFIEMGDFAQPGKPLLSLERQDTFRFESDVPESIATEIALGQDLEIKLAGLETKLTGKVAEISPTTDPNSRTRHIKLDLLSNSILRSGQFGYLQIPLAQRPRLLVPIEAVEERGQLEIVYVVNNNRAELRLIRTGKRENGNIEVLSGLQNGDVLIISKATELRDGIAVEVVQ